jgi:hypothetical protein
MIIALMRVPERIRRGLVKVRFELERSARHSYASETVWAEPVAGGRYRLRNSPFYAYGVSAEDVVFAKPVGKALFSFQSVSMRGGHSTYRALLKEGLDDDTFREFWRPLEKLGCTYEGANGELLAVDVPPHADIHAVFELLKKGESSGVWSFEEGHCGHPLARH